MDENGSQRLEQLSMASGGERSVQVLSTNLREAGVRRDLQMEKLHETGRHSLNVHGDGQHHDAFRKDRETTRQDTCVSRAGLHHCGKVGLVRVRAGGSDLVGRQSVGRRVSVSLAAS